MQSSAEAGKEPRSGRDKGRFVRVKQIASSKGKQGLLPISVATVWRWTANGAFPKPIKWSDGTTVWDMADIEAWQRAKQLESQKGAV
jgi:predicted DNA-binding transcriptional regulator AlpA